MITLCIVLNPATPNPPKKSKITDKIYISEREKINIEIKNINDPETNNNDWIFLFLTPAINNDPIRQPAPSAPTKTPNKVGLILRIVSAITGTMLVVGNAQILQTIVTSRTVLNIWFLIKDLKGLDTLYFSTEFGIFFLVLLKISNDIINEIK